MSAMHCIEIRSNWSLHMKWMTEIKLKTLPSIMWFMVEFAVHCSTKPFPCIDNNNYNCNLKLNMIKKRKNQYRWWMGKTTLSQHFPFENVSQTGSYSSVGWNSWFCLPFICSSLMIQCLECQRNKVVAMQTKPKKKTTIERTILTLECYVVELYYVLHLICLTCNILTQMHRMWLVYVLFGANGATTTMFWVNKMHKKFVIFQFDDGTNKRQWESDEINEWCMKYECCGWHWLK